MSTRVLYLIACLVCVLAASAFPQTAQPQASGGSLNIKFGDVKWQKMFPQWTQDSPEIAILHVDPKTQATQLLIRAPKNFHVTRHWHTANETHTVISGTFIVECDGKREELGPGSFNYMPGKMIHQAWTKVNEEVVVFITVDGPWDLNWVDGPPVPPAKQ
jgi:mannose-6-phosphate isomerase-like protein (cupin superfamily)